MLHKILLFDSGVAPHDIALIKLKTPIFMTERVRAVALPRQDQEFTGQVNLTGWGAIGGGILFPKVPKELQVANIPLVDYNTCLDAVKKLDKKAELYPTQVCTGPLGGDVSACSVSYSVIT